jgi:hypothetical protein
LWQKNLLGGRPRTDGQKRPPSAGEPPR